MQRVAVVGPGGAGKTRFSRALGARTGLPVVHLDRHYWKPGWVASDDDEWRIRQQQLFAAEHWIADGNYSSTFDERFSRADTVVVLTRPRLLCVLAAMRRSVVGRGRALQAEGCPERFDLSFYRWIWHYERRSGPRLAEALARHEGLVVVELRSRRAMRRFLAALPLG